MAKETINGLVNQAPRAFTGTLPGNYIYTGIFNMIISQQIFSDNIKGLYNDLAEHFKVDGSMYGDRKLFYATDGINSVPWFQDQTSPTNFTNVLELHRNNKVSVQEVVLNQYRQIPLTVDNYLSKKAWGDEGSFAKFNSIMLQWIGDSKRIYESKLVNAHVGTVKGAADINSVEITFETGATGKADIEAQNRLNAQAIKRTIEDLFDEMKDASRDYNDYKYLRSYDKNDLYIVYNSKFANQITYVDLPSIFHKDKLDPEFATKLPAKYFGTVITATNVGTYSASTPAAGKPLTTSTGVYVPGTNHANGYVRVLNAKKVTVSTVEYDLLPGDEIPTGATVLASSGDFAYGEVYIENANVIAKIMHKDSIPFMSGFNASTEFFNARNLSSNHYLTWGYSELTYLKNYPMIEVLKK